MTKEVESPEEVRDYQDIIDEYNKKRLLKIILQNKGCGGPCKAIIAGAYGTSLSVECPMSKLFCYDRACSIHFQDLKKMIRNTAISAYIEMFGEEELFEEML